MTNKTPSPWSADFYRTNTEKCLDDTIEHGGPGSGRYPKGSGKDKIARKEARNIRKNSRKIRKTGEKPIAETMCVRRKKPQRLCGTLG